MLADTGLRVSEACSIKIEDIDFLEGRLSVIGKGDNEDLVRISERALSAIRDYLNEQDLRALVRRDRNSPSVIMWSIGNEVGEQYAGEEGAALAEQLRGIIREEDETRPTTSAMNWARPDMPFPAATDVISLNYQGEGIRQDPMFEGTDRIRTSPQYPAFHAKFPGKVILSKAANLGHKHNQSHLPQVG